MILDLLKFTVLVDPSKILEGTYRHFFRGLGEICS